MSLKQKADKLQILLRESVEPKGYRIVVDCSNKTGNFFIRIIELDNDMKDDCIKITDYFDCYVDTNEWTEGRVNFIIEQYQSVELDYLNEIMKKVKDKVYDFFIKEEQNK